MAEIFSYTLTLSNQDDFSGFGMDLGGSIMKVAYVTKEEDNTLINMVAYSIDDIDSALESLKIRLSGLVKPGAQIYTTGLGCNKYKDKINSTLDIKINNVIETAANASALTFLAENCLLSDFTCSRNCEEAKVFVSNLIENMINMKAGIEKGEKLEGTMKEFADTEDIMSLFEDPDDSHQESQEQQQSQENADSSATTKSQAGIKFPVLLCTLGSGTLYQTAYADSSFVFEGAYTTGGRMLLGLGSLLTGAKNYKEIIDLAEAGDAGQVETRIPDLTSESSDDFYSLMHEDFPMYCYGKAQGKSPGDFKKEDLAAAVVSQLTQSLAFTSQSVYLGSDACTIIFSGGLCSESQLIRTKITKHLLHLLHIKPKTTKTDVYFLKHGVFLGAIGTLVHLNASKCDKDI